jgi:oligopeptide transport system ATP-binding protein
MAIMWITHDLGVVAELAHRINVMYAGSIIETGIVRNIYKKTKHPYTIGLLGSLPRIYDAPETELASIPGLPPDLLELPAGCPFAARCGYRIEKCIQEKPPLEAVDGDAHLVACWRWKEIAGIDQNER